MELSDIPDVSVIIPACNQGDWVRRTIPLALESLGRLTREVIVVDDHSLDGCCHRLGTDVTVLHPHTRLGVSGARRFAVEHSIGNVIVFSDPHCEYPDRTLEKIAILASKTGHIIQPRTKFTPDTDKTYAGSILAVCERGLWTKPVREPARHPALYNTIYAVRRDVYEKTGGWPLLPGVWSGSEQAWSLAAWCTGVPINVDDSSIGVHYQYHDNRRFPFSMPRSDWAKNTHYVHAAFFPKTYEIYWKTIITQHFGDVSDHQQPLRSKGFRQLRKWIADNRVRSEDQFFNEVLDMKSPMQTDHDFEAEQRTRATPKLHAEATPRIDRAIHWLIKAVPGCLKNRRIMDIGTRDGYTVTQLTDLGAREVAGIEVVHETAEFANKNTGGRVRHADMRSIPESDASWDLVTCIHALEHVPDPDTAIREMLRIVKPGGWLFIVVPLEESPSKRWAHNCCFASCDDVKSLVSACDETDGDTIQTDVAKYSGSGNNECRFLVRKKMSRSPERRAKKLGDMSEARFPDSLRNPDCKDASLWQSADGATAEAEVSELVAAFVRALHPDLVVETGSCEGITAKRMGEALRRNGHGRLVSFEIDSDRATKAQDSCVGLSVEIEQMPVWEWEPPDGQIVEFAFFDAEQHQRKREFKHLRKWMSNKTIVAFHDTNPLKRGRRQVETLAALGLIQPLFLPTPRGICFARVLDALPDQDTFPA